MTRKPVFPAIASLAALDFALLGFALLGLSGCSHGGTGAVAEDDGCPRFLGHNACELERARQVQPRAPAPPPPAVAMQQDAPAPPPAAAPQASPQPAPPAPVTQTPPAPSAVEPVPVPAPMAASAPPPTKPVHHFFWQPDAAPATPKPQRQAQASKPAHPFFWQQPSQAPQPLIVGGYQRATDQKAVAAAAAFAVHESPGYVLKGIYSAKTQVVAGTNYSLCLWVRQIAHEANPIHRRMVAATVFQGLDGHYELTAWHETGMCQAGS